MKLINYDYVDKYLNYGYFKRRREGKGMKNFLNEIIAQMFQILTKIQTSRQKMLRELNWMCPRKIPSMTYYSQTIKSTVQGCLK